MKQEWAKAGNAEIEWEQAGSKILLVIQWNRKVKNKGNATKISPFLDRRPVLLAQVFG